jgi:carbamoyltransferase
VLKDAFRARFRFDDAGLIVSDFPSGSAMRKWILDLCKGHSREDASASIQAFVEEMILESVGRLLDTHKVRKLGLAGGLFANVKLNQRLAENTGVDEVFVVPPMGDDGLVIGGALQYLLERDGLDAWLKHRHRLDDVYWGRGFGIETGRRILTFSPSVGKLDGNPVETTARLLDEGNAVAIVTKRMEYGPRALGARSIMASPRRRDINDSLNARLDRSEFMPFAPVIAEEDARNVFNVTGVNAYACRFMTITCDVNKEWETRIPAIMHVDNTARPQIIRRADNPLYYDILSAFKARTGLPALVNTSFNVHEEPIINTPEESAQALVDDRVDYIVTEDGVYGCKDKQAGASSRAAPKRPAT